MSIIKIKPDELRDFNRYIHSVSGISLDETKAYLLETRFRTILEETSCVSFYDLYRKILGDRTGVLERKIINAITTNETFFFRDNSPFDLLRYKILPEIIDNKNGGHLNFPLSLSILSAGCSSGQEIYSCAIVLKEILGDPYKHHIKLQGIDISDDAVRRASYGEYNKFEMERGLSQTQIYNYFDRHENIWRIKDELRGLASFKKQNMLKDLSSLGRFDIIFCRNVAIYFNENDKICLFKNLSRILSARGYLIIGSTELITNICPWLESKRYLRGVYYQFKPGINSI